MSGKITSLMLLAAVCCGGCAHQRLALGHVGQAKTLTAIQEQQVLDNLAMFATNPDALPFYARPGAGSAVITDNGSLDVSTLNGPGRTLLGPLGLSRDNRVTWASTPITDPAKLALMRCAYRRALGIGDGSDACIDCCELYREWVGAAEGDYSACCNCCSIRPLKIERCSQFAFPRRYEKVGSYCGTTIRVNPESYDDFFRLVTAILDYAINEPAEVGGPATMTVQQFEYAEDRLSKIKTYEALIETDEEVTGVTADGSTKTTYRRGPVREGKPVPRMTPSIMPRLPGGAAGGLDAINQNQILLDSIFPRP